MIKFTKMEALGNDYIYFDCTKINLDEKSLPTLSKTLSNRHFGIGSDGIILILPSTTADFKMRIFNSDGSQAQMCGNGIRCVGKFVYEKGLTQKNNLTIETLAGIKNLKLEVQNNKVIQITVDMGKPIFVPEKIPLLSKQNSIYLTIDNKNFEFTCVSMGNPHAVTFVDNLDNLNVKKYGKIIENDKHFPDKINVEFAQVIDKNNIKMRVYERGSGETMACGTGACAVCAASVTKNLANAKETVNIILPGGNLKIKWDENIFMSGSANFVFEGEFDYHKFLVKGD